MQSYKRTELKGAGKIPADRQTETISIAVAVYNGEAYLHRCIDSLLNQTYQNLEIILVDDGSTDESPRICDAYAEKDPRVKVVHKKMAGWPRAAMPASMPRRGPTWPFSTRTTGRSRRCMRLSCGR